MFSASKPHTPFWDDYEDAGFGSHGRFRAAWGSEQPPHNPASLQNYVEFDVVHPTWAANEHFSHLMKRPLPLKPHTFLNSKKQGSLRRWSREWIHQELYFSMNKLSLLAMVIALMFLGALFFTSGFLMAVNLYGIGAPIKTDASLVSLPDHMPTKGAVAQNPVDSSRNPTVPSQYTNVSGVAMVPSSRMPTSAQTNQRTPPQGNSRMPSTYVATAEPSSPPPAAVVAQPGYYAAPQPVYMAPQAYAPTYPAYQGGYVGGR